MEELFFNPFEDGFADNPYAQYARLRAHKAVYDGPLDTIFVFRYDDVRQVIQDPSLSSRDELATSTAAVLLRMQQFSRWMNRGVPSMMNADPPQHTRLRRLVSRAFTPGKVAALRGPLTDLTRRYLRQMSERERSGEPVDFMADFAFPLPCEIISGLLGVPKEDRTTLQHWSLSLTKAFEAFMDPREIDEITEAGDRLDEYVSALVTERRKEPQDDLISVMAAADGSDRLSDEELIDQVLLIYVAGHTTVSNFVGNSCWHLLRTRAHYEYVANTPDLSSAVDELLRFEPPTQFMRRITKDPCRIADRELEPGRLILACLGSANHDPDAFGPTSEELDLTRSQSTRLLSLGGGIHFCIGAALARIEGEVILSSLARAFPDAELGTDKPKWNGRVTFRGLAELPVRLGASLLEAGSAS